MPTDGNELSVPELARMLDVRGEGYEAGPVAKGDPGKEGEKDDDFEKWEEEVFPDVDIPGPSGPTPDSRVDGVAAGEIVNPGVTPLDVIRPGEVSGGRSAAQRGGQRAADKGRSV